MKTQYWVTMTDKFMSGWGKAEGKTNKYIVPCETWEQAEIVKENAERRSEMKYVNICANKPRYNKKYYFESYHNGEKGFNGYWYQPGSFSPNGRDK